ncbi:MAG: phenylalanyl-tRNA synthetase beta chain [Microgenomates group bacterium Gr01-1014_5]|nr:MAG: phenylalanyl-tRNA synthetase beta chain [Microgenomates group bacterium Gr01-1014_5]
MDILIPDSWLKDYLKTTAKPEKIAECLSLCGPSVEKVTPLRQGSVGGKDALYSIEVTTNRVDSAGVYGIAREAAAILPRFKVKAEFLPIKIKNIQRLAQRVEWLDVQVDHNLCLRFSAVLIRDVKLAPSPKLIQERLTAVGVRPINNVVDISNYLMHELGQPVHTFDYDKIGIYDKILGAKMILRSSKKGEKVTTLDGKSHDLPGGDIVIEDSKGRLIDLCGIMGGENSAVDEETHNVLLFVQTYTGKNIRRTSMALAARSEAASLFEKGLDPELVEQTIRRGIDLFVEICKGNPEKEILDLYPSPYEPKIVKTDLNFINERLGIYVSTSQVESYLAPLGFVTSVQGDALNITVPSWRAQDVDIPEDIVEEVARIYGYHNLPSRVMEGQIPDPLPDTPFSFEKKIKEALQSWGGIEVYTFSMVAKDKADLTGSASWVLKLKNPLGADSEYMRLSLAPSLVDAALQNRGESAPFHLFELANVYLPVRANLPEERMIAAGIFANTEFAQAKGTLEALFEILKSKVILTTQDGKGFAPHHRIAIRAGREELGQFGKLQLSGHWYWEIDIEALRKVSSITHSFKPLPKYPPQVEDLSLVILPRVHLGEVIEAIYKSDSQVMSVELKDSYENTRTLRVSYQNPDKTLTDREVEVIRNKVLKILEKKFGVKLKT